MHRRQRHSRAERVAAWLGVRYRRLRGSTPRRRLDAWCAAMVADLDARPWYGTA